MNIFYNDDKLFPLTSDELKLIDNVWRFMGIFRRTTISKNQYREQLKNEIKSKYNLDEFLKYEKIVEKLYWNLFDVIISYIKFDDTLKIHSIDTNKINSNNSIEKKILKRSTIGETTVKKSYIVKNNKIIYKYNYPNDLDLLLFSIMINRSLYETIMSEPTKITLDYLNDLITEPYDNLIEFDYGYPNFNTIKPFVYSEEQRKNNIINELYLS